MNTKIIFILKKKKKKEKNTRIHDSGVSKKLIQTNFVS